MHASVGDGCEIADDAKLGVEYTDGCGETVIGDDATIRSGVRIYGDVVVGDRLLTGHDALVREETSIGDDAVVGTDVVIEGNVHVGDSVKLETGAFIPTYTELGDHVFVGPHAVLTNDRYPQRRRSEYEPVGRRSLITLRSVPTPRCSRTLLSEKVRWSRREA